MVRLTMMMAAMAAVAVLVVTGAHAIDYTLTVNCNGYSWQGAACSQAPVAVSVPVGSHTVTISGLNVNTHPVSFTKNSTAIVPWSGAYPNNEAGNRAGTYTFTVSQSDVNTSIYYKCVTHSFFGKINFIASNVTASAVSSSTGTAMVGTQIKLSTCASDEGGSGHGYSWNGYICSDNSTGFQAPILAAGIYQVALDVTQNHPVIFTTDILNLPLWAGASPNSASGLYNPVTSYITLTVQDSDRGTVLYAYCATHGFRATFVLIAPSSSSSAAAYVPPSTGTRRSVSSSSSSTGKNSAIATAAPSSAMLMAFGTAVALALAFTH